MILYDEILVRLTGLDSFGDPVPGEVLDTAAPAEVWPVSSTETDVSPLTGTGEPKTVYRVATTFDFANDVPEMPVEWTAASTRVSIVYMGVELSTPAGKERHAISGRFDHYEFIAEDFGVGL